MEVVQQERCFHTPAARPGRAPGSCANYPCGEGEYMGCASNWLHPAYGLPSGPDQPAKSLHDPSMHLVGDARCFYIPKTAAICQQDRCARNTSGFFTKHQSTHEGTQMRGNHHKEAGFIPLTSVLYLTYHAVV